MAGRVHRSRKSLFGVAVAALGITLLVVRASARSSAPAATTAYGDTWPPVPVKTAPPALVDR